MRPSIVILLTFLMSAAIGMVSCSGQKTNTASADTAADSTAATADADSLSADEEAADMPKAADELFDDFIFNFSANKKLQLERIQFPLPSVNGQRTETIEKQQWQMDYFFMRQGYYTMLLDSEKSINMTNDTTVNSVILEKIYFNTTSVIQYFFERQHGLWMLTRINTIPFSQSSNASFLPFFHQFATDPEFQTASLNETVTFVGPDPDDDFSQMEGLITPDTWEAFAPTLPQKMIYNIIYGKPGKEGSQKVFLLRGIANGLELNMVFRRIDGQWKLTKLTT